MPEQRFLSREDSRYNLSLVCNWVTFADTKAATFLTIALAVFGLSLTDIPATTRVCRELLLQSGIWPMLLMGLILLLHGVLYGSLARCIFILVRIVQPTTNPTSGKHSWFFFQSMADLSPEQFHDFTNNLNEESLQQQLNDQVYNNSVVAKQKFEQLHNAIFWLGLSAIFVLLAVAPVLILDTLQSQVIGNP